LRSNYRSAKDFSFVLMEKSAEKSATGYFNLFTLWSDKCWICRSS